MKLALICSIAVVALTLVSAVPQDPTTKRSKSEIEKLAWMAGSWKSAEDKQSSEEHWTGPAGNLMVGMHRDVMGSKAFFEHLRIEQQGDKVYYFASPMGQPATRFEMVESAKARVVFENPKHDFPQRIIYWLEDGKMNARAEATRDGRSHGQTWTWGASDLK